MISPTLPREPPPCGGGCGSIARRGARCSSRFADLLGALTSIHAILGVRTSQGAIAWVVSLNTFPYVAVPAYWVFDGQTSGGAPCFDGRHTDLN